MMPSVPTMIGLSHDSTNVIIVAGMHEYVDVELLIK